MGIELDQDQMPNYFECSGKAGTAYIFDSATWCVYEYLPCRRTPAKAP